MKVAYKLFVFELEQTAKDFFPIERQNGFIFQASYSGKQQTAGPHSAYTFGSVTQDQSGRGFIVEKG